MSDPAEERTTLRCSFLFGVETGRRVATTLRADVAEQLSSLLDELAVAGPATKAPWQDWQIERIGGGANNRLYRTTRVSVDFAVKCTIRDDRHRAIREYQALQALQAAGLDLAP